MRFKTLLRSALVLVIGAMLLPFTAPAHAATTAVGRFYAGCNNFSVDVAVSGTHDDGNGLDKFRYLIVDGNGKKLYLEDAARSVNTTVGSLVINLSYDADGVVDGQPTKNPIKFDVIDLDGNNNQIGVLYEATYDAECLAASGKTNRAGVFLPNNNTYAQVLTATVLYDGPAGASINLAIPPGKVFHAVYRAADSQWVAISVSGNNLVWVPVTSLSVDLTRLPLPPGRIDGNSLSATAAPNNNNNGGSAIAGVTGRTLTSLRLRSSPAFTNNILTVVPFGTVVPVVGRNSSKIFVEVIYNGTFGWVSAFFLQLNGSTLAGLPIVPGM